MQNSPILKIESGLSTRSPVATDSPTLVENSELRIRETILWCEEDIRDKFMSYWGPSYFRTIFLAHEPIFSANNIDDNLVVFVSNWLKN